jgi:DNA-binding transcriptional LysR family regulator
MLLFVEVVTTGGIRAAAERLGLRKSTVSRRLAALEERREADRWRCATRQAGGSASSLV